MSNMKLDSSERLPADDVGLLYAQADETLQFVISRMLEAEVPVYMVSFLDEPEMLKALQDDNENAGAGFSLFRSPGMWLSSLAMGMLNSMARIEEAHEALGEVVAKFLSIQSPDQVDKIIEYADELRDE